MKASKPADRSWLAKAIVPVCSLTMLILMVGLVLSSAGNTLGYDYSCYQGAARHLLDGKAIYDNPFSISVGTCPGTYTYPPAFAVALVPWLALGGAAAGLWCVAMAICFIAGVALLPVRRDIRWLVVIIAAFDWPLLYAIKLGQVEPLLFLGFAAAWRWMDRPWVVGVVTALGALIKVQPGLLGVWALATRRYRAVTVAVGVAAGLAAAATIFTGMAAWGTYVDLLRGLGGTLSKGHNFAPGAAAYMAGAPDGLASAVQWASVFVAATALIAAYRWASPTASLMVTVVVSQLLSAPLRDHYAVLLLLPVAWLVSRGHKWAALIPLLGWISLFASDDASSWPAVASIPLTFFAVLGIVLWEARRERQEVPPSGRNSTVAADSSLP
ncbi:MAG TPA: glycosyltransferase family 87 protein [Candidatus Limnocylindrales bacterium]